MLLELSARAQKCGFDAALAAVKARGQRFDRFAVEIAQDEHAAHLFALRAQKRADAAAELCCHGLVVGRGQGGGAVVQLVEREREGVALTLLRRPRLIAVQRQIARDLAEKGREDRGPLACSSRCQ